MSLSVYEHCSVVGVCGVSCILSVYTSDAHWEFYQFLWLLLHSKSSKNIRHIHISPVKSLYIRLCEDVDDWVIEAPSSEKDSHWHSNNIYICMNLTFLYSFLKLISYESLLLCSTYCTHSSVNLKCESRRTDIFECQASLWKSPEIFSRYPLAHICPLSSQLPQHCSIIQQRLWKNRYLSMLICKHLWQHCQLPYKTSNKRCNEKRSDDLQHRGTSTLWGVFLRDLVTKGRIVFQITYRPLRFSETLPVWPTRTLRNCDSSITKHSPWHVFITGRHEAHTRLCCMCH